MKKNLFFSIIITVYNSEAYLKKAITSVLVQRIKDLEIILVNDNSKDKSLKICKQFGKKNKNIIVINNKKNFGPGKSRNIGIKKAKGKYIIHLDSDDYILQNSLRNIKRKIIKNNFPSVILNNTTKGDRKNANSHLLSFFSSKVYNKDFFIKIMLKKNIYFSEIWNIVYKRNNVLKNLRFIETRLAEDNAFVLEVILKMENILINKDTLIHHTTRMNSLKNLLGLRAVYGLLVLLNKYRNLYSDYKRNFLFKKYIDLRSKTALRHLKTYVYLLEKNDTIKLQKLKNEYLFYLYGILKYKSHKNKISKKDYLLKIRKFKKEYTNQLNKILPHNNKNYKANLFCVDYIAKLALKYLNEKKVKINKIIDEDKNYSGQYILGKKIYKFSKIKNNDLKNSVNLICHQNKKVYKSFVLKLKKFRVNKADIIHFKTPN